MGKWKDEIIGNSEHGMMRKRVNARMGGRENGKMRSNCTGKKNGNLECKSFFKSLKTDI
jgi:hypothetical protein